MSYMARRFSPFRFSSISGTFSITTGSSIGMNVHASSLGANNTSAISSTLGRLLMTNIRTVAATPDNAYFNFDPKETVPANCSGSEYRASAPASAVGSEMACAIAPASYTPKVNVGDGYLPSSTMQTDSWVLSI